jgi:PiT family inorganic phosphate transporter
MLSVSLYYIFVKSVLEKKTTFEERYRIRRIFLALQIVMGSLLALAIAGNNVGIAMGIGVNLEPVLHLELAGALGLTVGISVWGKRVIRAITGGLTKLTPEKAFFAQLSGFMVLIFFVLNGVPSSPTTLVIAAIMGVGMSSGRIRKKKMRDLLFTWALIIPLSIIIGFLITWLILI